MVKVFYAFKDTQRPMINGLISVALNVVLSIVLSKLLGVWGISLATSIAMLVASVFMFVQLRFHLPCFETKLLLPDIAKGFIAFIITSIALLFLNNHLRINNVFVVFIVKALLSSSLYVMVLFLLKPNAIVELKSQR